MNTRKREKMEEVLQRGRNAYEGRYARQIRELLGLSLLEIEAMIPGGTENDIYDALVWVVMDASRLDLSEEELGKRIEALGRAAVEIARILPGLAGLLPPSCGQGKLKGDTDAGPGAPASSPPRRTRTHGKASPERALRVTVCELTDRREDFPRDWEALIDHVRTEGSDLVLLPEMPFSSWFPGSRRFDPERWQAALSDHDLWQARLSELSPAAVLGSRPVNLKGRRLNQGFVWDRDSGYRAAHAKYYLPDDEGFWEASWYERGDEEFIPVEVGEALVGFAICTELWFMERARAYGREGVHIMVTPRASGPATVDKWLVGGRAASVISGAFSLSSNFVSGSGPSAHFGGQGWITGPDGEVLGLTSRERPFVTLRIDLTEAEKAKKTYPRYVGD